MAGAPGADVFTALAQAGEGVVTEEEYEHGYSRVVRHDLRKHVLARVGVERVALSIETVEEISKPPMLTLVPRTTPFVLGIANVRGNVIPFVDLAHRMGIARMRRDNRERCIIVNQDGERWALVVDAIEAVVDIEPESFQPAPGGINEARGAFIAALARIDTKLVIVLDLRATLDERACVAAGVGGARG